MRSAAVLSVQPAVSGTARDVTANYFLPTKLLPLAAFFGSSFVVAAAATPHPPT